MQVVIPYNKLEAIYGDYSIKYKGFIWNTKEDLKTFPDILTLSNPLPTEEFNKMMLDFVKAIGGGK